MSCKWAEAVLRTRDAVATATPDLIAPPTELNGTWLRYADLRAVEAVTLDLPTTAIFAESRSSSLVG